MLEEINIDFGIFEKIGKIFDLPSNASDVFLWRPFIPFNHREKQTYSYSLAI